ncbi:MAG TPA: cysteine hydrolase family protein [bacterium]|nr:cysteine hydrolase family protein [bacterium]
MKNLTPKDRPALLLVDLQKGFDTISYWGNERNNLGAEENCRSLLELWRSKDLPVVHVQHCSANPNSLLADTHPGNAFKDAVQPLPWETVIKKNVNSAFIGTTLQKHLTVNSISKLVIVGLTTDHCISTTTRMAGNYGYEVFLISDATATFDKTGMDGKKYSAELIHQTALASLHGEFATVFPMKTLLQNFS